MELKHTQRGFGLIEFTDEYRQECSIQKSSLATKDALWLGVDKGIPDENGFAKPVNGRMHLTRSQVAELLPILHWFVKHGEVYVPERNELVTLDVWERVELEFENALDSEEIDEDEHDFVTEVLRRIKPQHENKLIGTCENCSEVIFEDEGYGKDLEGVFLCSACCSDLA